MLNLVLVLLPVDESRLDFNYILLLLPAETLVAPDRSAVLMEAQGKYDFNATADDELSFRKGDVLKVRL